MHFMCPQSGDQLGSKQRPPLARLNSHDWGAYQERLSVFICMHLHIEVKT